MIDHTALGPCRDAGARARILNLRGVSVFFGATQVLNKVCLQVSLGEIHGLMGPNGAGKTTLFDVISGVLRPSSGTVMIDGTDVSRWSTVRRAATACAGRFNECRYSGASAWPTICSCPSSRTAAAEVFFPTSSVFLAAVASRRAGVVW